MSREGSTVYTKISEKSHSPLIVRKYVRLGYPVFVALITDDDIDDLDKHLVEEEKFFDEPPRGLEECRKLAGRMMDSLVGKYKRAEGVAVLIFADKYVVSSLWGDFMTHQMCRDELYNIINIMTKV